MYNSVKKVYNSVQQSTTKADLSKDTIMYDNGTLVYNTVFNSVKTMYEKGGYTLSLLALLSVTV